MNEARLFLSRHKEADRDESRPGRQECPRHGVQSRQDAPFWDFKGEANTIFEDIHSDAQHAMDHADMLQMLSRGPNVGWQANAVQLGQMSHAINDIEGKVCRLEAIRRVVSPEQQRTIDQIAAEARLMAFHQQDAYNFCTTHAGQMWHPAFLNDVANLYNETSALKHAAGKAVQFARLSKEYQEVGRKLGGLRTGS